MKKLRLLVPALCLLTALTLSTPMTVLASDGPQGGSNSSRTPPPPPPPPPGSGGGIGIVIGIVIGILAQ